MGVLPAVEGSGHSPEHPDMTPSVEDWLAEWFGTTEESLLQPEAYPDEDLRKDRIALERKLAELEAELEEHREGYRELLRTGADADDAEKRQLAERAKQEKKKFALKQQQLEKVETQLATVLAVEAVRELLHEDETSDLVLESAVDEELDPGAFQSRLAERAAEFGVDRETMDAVQEHLGLDSGPDVDEVQDELMGSMAQYDVDVETIQGELDLGPDGPGGAASSTGPDAPDIDEDIDTDLPEGLSNGESDDADEFEGDAEVSADEGEDTEGDAEWRAFDHDERQQKARIGSGEPLADQFDTGTDIDVTVRRPTDGLVETVLRLRDHYLVCSMYEDRYAVTWEAPVDVTEFLDIQTPIEEEAVAVEVCFSPTPTEGTTRRHCTLAEARDDDRFPEGCAFLALEYDGYERTWEREGTHTEGHELTVAVDGYGAEPFRTALLESLGGELGEADLTELLGRLSGSLDTDAPRADEHTEVGE
jgi:hypothetical protein